MSSSNQHLENLAAKDSKAFGDTSEHGQRASAALVQQAYKEIASQNRGNQTDIDYYFNVYESNLRKDVEKNFGSKQHLIESRIDNGDGHANAGDKVRINMSNAWTSWNAKDFDLVPSKPQPQKFGTGHIYIENNQQYLEITGERQNVLPTKPRI